MRRVYNEKISRKANDSLNQRARKVMIQKRVIAIAGILIVSLLILLGSSIRTFASSRDNKPLHKYYTSIQIEKGDSLWTLSDKYIVDGVYSKDDFIKETSELNHLTNQDELHAGDYLTIAYYSTEIKYSVFQPRLPWSPD